MDIIKNYNDPEIKKYVYSDDGSKFQYDNGLLVVNERTEKYHSVSVRADKLLGEKEAYRAQIKLKLKEGSFPFVICCKYTIEYLGLEYTKYDLGTVVTVTDTDFALLQHKIDIPSGGKVLSVVFYFIQQRETNIFPDVYVSEYIVEEAEAMKTVSFERNTAPLPRQEKLTFGVIRWDAYMETGKPSSFVSDQVARSLSPRKYHKMAPFFAKVTGEDKVEFGIADQAQFDKEADLAIKAGIDYFAYCWYGDKNPMSYARKQHLASSLKDKIKMCAIIGVSKLDEDDVKSIALAMKDNCYLRFDSRPVVYVYDAFRIDTAKIKAVTDAAKAAGITDEIYYIGMAGQPSPFIINEFLKKGIDAIGAYGCAAKKTNEEYDNLAYLTEVHNEEKYAFSDKIDVVPLVNCGRDTRPRIENPVSWAGDYAGRFAKIPTGEELYNHASRVLAKMRNEKEKNIPNTVITYAWNEHDEGGWCCPTLAVDADGQPIYDENGIALMNCSGLNALARAITEHRMKE